MVTHKKCYFTRGSNYNSDLIGEILKFWKGCCLRKAVVHKSPTFYCSYIIFGLVVFVLFTVYGVCLPGRESRFSEPFNTDWESLVKDICQDVQGILREKPFALWGHRLVASSHSK